MDTKERQYVREVAYTMEATYQDDTAGLKTAQQNAHHVIEGLREILPNESDETLACAARAVARVVARLAQTPMAYAGEALAGMSAAYPFAAGALAGVYVLPPHDCDQDGTAPKPVPEPPVSEPIPGGYL